ncbi:uncharacterized protein LOC130716934 isoform X2 [Lotus japonicus]|uniref:uncharacterized protein LOC130716934 isoform X2 n=1 Tax=Lotus japonicus TaxID=34305 RepID=UPI0025869FC8|nr:uncharacterized protein LOC130716934 isoform X2 [Lotus japonicus]
MASNPEQTIPLATELKLDESKRVAIPEPPNEAEKRAIWKSQVLIPFSVNGTLRAILGPLKVVKHDRPNSLPEDHESFHPSVRGEELILAFQPSYRMPFLSDPKRAFRSAPPNPSANDKAYLKWLDRVEEDKRQHWKDVGILDLIQLSRSPISYNPAMLLSALYFWERSTTCLHVPFGMITPSLLDVAAITGLWPIGDDYHSAPATVKPISIPTDNISFSRFIKDHYVESGEVSDAEHVAFLLYWLSAYVFCTKSLRIPAKLLPLANLLHEGRQLAMARLVLGNLYQMLNEAVEDIRNTKTVSLNAAGPLWLFQLWLNAVFESLLPAQDNPPTVSNTKIDAHILETLTPAYDASSFEADFRKYFTMFLELKHYRSSFSPYSKAVRGPFWLRNSYPNASDSALPKEHHITLWRTLLSPRVLTVGFASSDYTLCGYNPQLVSRQFGLSQVLPNTLFDKSLVLYPGAIKRASAFDTTVQFYNKKLLNLSPFTYAPSYYATNAFKAWWSEYWAQISKPLVDCLQCMTDAFLLQKQDPKKTKAEVITRLAPQVISPVAHSSKDKPVVIEDDDDDDEDDDVSLADKLKSRKRKPKPVASASQKRAKGAGVSTPSGVYKLASDAQPEVVDAAIQASVHEHSTSNLPSRETSPAPNPAKSKAEGVEKPPKAASSAKKTSTSEGRKKVRSKSGHKSPRRSRSSTNSSPSKESACQVSLYFSCFVGSSNMHFTLQETQGATSPIREAEPLPGKDDNPMPPPKSTATVQPSPQAKGGSSSHVSSEKLDTLFEEDPLEALDGFLDGTLEWDSPPHQADATAETAQSSGVANFQQSEESMGRLKAIVFASGFLDQIQVDPQAGHAAKELLVFLLGQRLDSHQAAALANLQSFLADASATFHQVKDVGQAVSLKEAKVSSGKAQVAAMKEDFKKFTARKVLIADEISEVDTKLEELHREVAKLEKKRADLVEEGPAVKAQLDVLTKDSKALIISTKDVIKELEVDQAVKKDLDAKISTFADRLNSFKSLL